MDIREIRERSELDAVEKLQKEVWDCSDLEVLPAIHMIAAREVGAILIGAFEGGELIAFVYGFPGFEGEHRILMVLPLFHIYGLSAVMLLGFRVGAELVLHVRFDPGEQLIQAEYRRRTAYRSDKRAAACL